jgi:ATP-binding cassette subfamily B protein/subfamily B ATP-binding cassette protein MsbA
VAITYVALGSLVLFALASTLDIWLTLLWVRAGNSMVFELSRDMVRHLQRRSVLFHARNPVGDSMSRVLVDTYGLQTVLNALLFAPLHAIVMTAAMLIVLLTLDVGLAGAALAVALGMTVASLLAGKAIRRSSREARDAEGDLQSHLHHVLSGVAVVQAFAQERREFGRFLRYTEQVIAAKQRNVVFKQLNGLGTGLFDAVGTALILWLAAGRVLDGEMRIGTMLLFLAYLRSLTKQVKVLAGVYGSVQSSRAQVDRVYEIVSTRPEVTEVRGARPIQRVRGHVVFEDVSFAYEPSRRTLDRVSFEARPGRTVAIVGPSGAGKTTLISLVARLFDADSGRVLIDGFDIRRLTLESLRSNVAIVLQDPFLFPVSIADNIAYGRPGASRKDIEDAARAANAHEFIVALPNGYDTVLGERGSTLSGGQRQRISIARALLKDAPILILDEPTSALDPQSERLLLEALKRLRVGRTTLVIAHRLSTIRDADEILVLEGGRVVETGRHRDLVRARGTYARLHRRQTSQRQRKSA